MFEFQKDCGLELIKEMVAEDKNTSRIYGFILYTDKDPYVAKVLRDNDFWNGLNCISGSNWPIFAVRPLQVGQMRIQGSSPGMMSYLVSTWEEPKANLPIIRDFGLKDSKDSPLFVAFMWDDTDKLNQIAIPIMGNDIDSTYHSIEEIVKVITRVEAAILPEYKGTINVFRNVKSELEALQIKHKVIERGLILKKIAEFCSVFIR